MWFGARMHLLGMQNIKIYCQITKLKNAQISAAIGKPQPKGQCSITLSMVRIWQLVVIIHKQGRDQHL